jgi:fatty acid desaturase
VLVGNAALVHESVHGHLFASPAANRALGTLAAAPLLVSWASYRAYHFEHHRRATRAGDPEGTPLRFRTRLAYVVTMLAAGVAVTGEGFWFGLRTAVGRAPVWVRTAAQRRAILENLVVLAAVVALAVVGIAVAPGPTLRLWVVPALLAMLLLAPFMFLPEHYGADGDGPILANTMTIVSNPVVRYVFWNTNHHAAHHLTPGVPFHAIGRVDALIAPDVAPRWRVRSYLAFHGARLRNEPPEGRAAH